MEDPTVNAVAHLTGRRIGRRPGIELDIDAILQKAVETGCAIEINAALGRLDASSEVLYRARELDVTFVISTDHHTRARAHGGVLQATRGRSTPRIANTCPKKFPSGSAGVGPRERLFVRPSIDTALELLSAPWLSFGSQPVLAVSRLLLASEAQLVLPHSDDTPRLA
jgi:hypothetical protein